MSASKIYDPFLDQNFSYENCFLCGTPLNRENRADEHVYPKWLQRKFNLWNKTIHLLNGTQIRYKSLYIPCCKNCNSLMKIKLEDPIKNAVDIGYDEFIKLDEKLIFQWLVKLSYGLLFKELSLKADLKSTENQNIISPEILSNFDSLHTFLQTIRFNTKFFGCNPWSILLFKIKTYDYYENYNAQDFVIPGNFFFQMNDIGIISNLHDNGYSKDFFLQFDFMSRLLKEELHPLQFAEISAKCLYKSSLFNRNPKYTLSWNETNPNDSLLISHDIFGDAYETWNQEAYAHYLEFFFKLWNIKFEEIYHSDDKVITYLTNDDGSFKIVNEEV